MLERLLDLNDPRLDDFTQLTDVQLRKKLEIDNGLYIAESINVITRAVAAGHTPRAFLILEEWLPKIESIVIDFPDVPVFIAQSQQLEELTGFHMHRGALAAMHRPEPLDPEELIANSKFLVVLDGLSDHTNVGAIFRSIAALGADGVLLTQSTADPLYRRAVRVSMGAVLQVPWARLPEWRLAGPLLREHDFNIIGMGLDDNAIDLNSFINDLPSNLALVLGAEGPGLSKKAFGACDYQVKICMKNGVDSLNVATAASIALWAIGSKRSEIQDQENA
ncbi:MAG TPA: RNA methyltransferase [Microbacteriaceae bacterium]|nr:RNA methyltransferase [Microbacteriaceae bacterium]